MAKRKKYRPLTNTELRYLRHHYHKEHIKKLLARILEELGQFEYDDHIFRLNNQLEIVRQRNHWLNRKFADKWFERDISTEFAEYTNIDESALVAFTQAALPPRAA